MKRMLKSFLSLLLIVSSAGTVIADNCSTGGCSTTSCETSCETACKPCNSSCVFMPRSCSVNAARELVGWQTHINMYDQDELYASFSMTPEYHQSFRSKHIAEFLFGCDLDACQKLRISGSCVTDRGDCDWLADYFCLAPDFDGTVSFNPRIKNFSLDFNLFVGLDNWWEGAWFRIHAPICYSSWDLRAKEDCGTNNATLGFNPGYMDCTTAGVVNADLETSFLNHMNGCSKTCGDLAEPLKFGKICGKQTKTRLGDIQAALGWNFLNEEDYHVGLGLRAAAPTGNRPSPEFLFGPVSGNGHHWELGATLTSHYTFWRSEDEENMFGMYVDANITHLFDSRQCRCFDFCGKPNSRYMLISELGTPVENLFGNTVAGDQAGSTTPNLQYQKKLFHAINKTIQSVDVSIGVQADVVVKFSYQYGNWGVDLGYNLWARSGEKFDCKTECCLDTEKYGIKGDAYVCGFGANDSIAAANALRNVPIPLSATQKDADIHGGKNFSNTLLCTAVANQANPRIDNPQFARLVTGNGTSDSIMVTPATAGTVATNLQRTSINPDIISRDDLDMSKSPSAISHKVFTHIDYSWNDNDDWIPFVGMGGEVEFGAERDGAHAAVSQWGVWIKGGLSFR